MARSVPIGGCMGASRAVKVGVTTSSPPPRDLSSLREPLPPSCHSTRLLPPRAYSMRRPRWRYYHSMDEASAPPASSTPHLSSHQEKPMPTHHEPSDTFKEITEESEEGFDRVIIHTNLPHRLDVLPFSVYHWFLVLSLGVTWVLDGLEITILSVVSAHLKREDTLNLTDVQVGLATSAGIFGAILGSLLFGYLCDRYGRKKLYLATPIVYTAATGLSAFCWEFYGFALMRFITGAGLGGEYSAINSAIDELIPAKVRGHVDLAVNGSYWFGAAIAAALSLKVLDPGFLGPADFGWRFMFGIGAVLGVGIIVARLYLPESPRWLMTHGRVDEAEEVVRTIEKKVELWNARVQALPLPSFLCGNRVKPREPQYFSSGDYEVVDEDRRSYESESDHITIIPRTHTSLREVFRAMLILYPKRSVLGLALMVSQAFFYNAVFFSYALILVDFHGVSSDRVGLYLLPFAIGNFLGPLTLGRLFDTVGRRRMIALTYTLSAVLLLVTGWLFEGGLLGALTQTIMWSVVFYIASPAASAAYLTVSEIFPLEIRALAISVFYSLGTGVGGVAAPVLFGWLLQTKRAENILYGYIVATVLMILAALIEVAYGVDAEQQSLEHITAPLSALPQQSSPSSTTATGHTSLASSSSMIFLSHPATPSSSFSQIPLTSVSFVPSTHLSYPYGHGLASDLRSSSTDASCANGTLSEVRSKRDKNYLTPLRPSASEVSKTSLPSTPSPPMHGSPSVPPALALDETEFETSDTDSLADGNLDNAEDNEIRINIHSCQLDGGDEEKSVHKHPGDATQD